MPKRSPKINAQPEISVKREIWKNNRAYSVARESGRWVKVKKWHSKKDTEEVKTYVIYIKQYPEKKYRKPLPSKPYGYNFKRTGIKPDKYVYLLQAKFDKEYRTFSMTSTELYEMNENTKISLFSATRQAYGDSPIKLKLLRVYNSITGEIIRKYTGQRFED
jgi:hypothetical protein